MRYLNLGFVLAAVSFLVGCGGGQAGVEGTTAVTGTVTYEGQPVERATVTFSPSGDGRAASGTTDASGEFELTTLTASDGVLPGTYNVAVSKTEVEGALTGEEAQAYFEEHNRAPTVTKKDLLPKKYKDPQASGLTAEVTEGGGNDFTFELTD